MKEETKITCPICNAKIEVSKAKFKAKRNGKTFYFCNLACKLVFDTHGQMYA